MLIECLIKREGPTRVGLDKFNYVFEPNEFGASVCEVNSRSHRDYLLSLRDFRIYEAPVREIVGDGIETDSGDKLEVMVEPPVRPRRGRKPKIHVGDSA